MAPPKFKNNPSKKKKKKKRRNQHKMSVKPFEFKPEGKSNNVDDTVLPQEQSSIALQLEEDDDVPYFRRHIKPGLVVRAKIITVYRSGATVQFKSGAEAVCPLQHMSESEITEPGKEIRVGDKLIFRVLSCDSKRITVTHKKTLVKSKLEILSSYADAVEGLITHGWITKIENHGCFVQFYNGVQGFAPRYELGLDVDSDITSMYHVQEVVECRVTSSNATTGDINLNFITKPRSLADTEVNIGSLVSGIVEQVTPHGVIKLNIKSDMKGTIAPEHLADHQGRASLLKSAVRPGYEFDQLLVIDMEGCNAVLTSKYSLVNSANQLPSDITQVHPHSVVHGYVSKLDETGCFVRFLGHLTGFAPNSKAPDDGQCNLSEVFYIGQSVRSFIDDVDSSTNRITLSLNHSSCSSIDTSFIHEYFLLDEKVARLHLSNSQVGELSWVDKFIIGSIVEGVVTETKNFGVVVRFHKYRDVFGIISHYQLGGMNVEPGATVQAAVLDVSRLNCLVELSLKPVFKFKWGRPNKEFWMNETVNAQVEIVNEDYLVLSLRQYNFSLGYASVTDYNTQKFPRKQFSNGQTVTARIASLPSPSTSGRLLLALNMEDSSSREDIKDEARRLSAKEARKCRKQHRRAAEQIFMKKYSTRNEYEFEKVVESFPHCGFVWLTYIDFMLSLPDVKKARSIAERAFTTIKYSKVESDKLNIWVAYFNLEKNYGNPLEGAVMKLFQRALQIFDPKSLYLALLGIFEKPEELKLVDEALDNEIVEKLNISCEVWLGRVHNSLKQNSDAIELIMEQALACLPSRKHDKFYIHTAVLEFKMGVADKGRKIFENLIKRDGKRVDFWSIYLDQEIGLGDQVRIRALFERAINLGLQREKMMYFYDEYFDYEESFGDEEQQQLAGRRYWEFIDSYYY